MLKKCLHSGFPGFKSFLLHELPNPFCFNPSLLHILRTGHQARFNKQFVRVEVGLVHENLSNDLDLA